MFYAYSIQNIDSYELIPGMAHYHIILISQHYNFMLINFMYFSILIFPGRVMQYLDEHGGLSFFCCKNTPHGWHPGAKTCKGVILDMK
jgi:hypothetical protein